MLFTCKNLMFLSDFAWKKIFCCTKWCVCVGGGRWGGWGRGVGGSWRPLPGPPFSTALIIYTKLFVCCLIHKLSSLACHVC